MTLTGVNNNSVEDVEDTFHERLEYNWWLYAMGNGYYSCNLDLVIANNIRTFDIIECQDITD